MTAPPVNRAEALQSSDTRQPAPETSAPSTPAPVADYVAQLKSDAEGLVSSGLAVPRRLRRVLSTKVLRKKAVAKRLAILVAVGAIGGMVGLIVLLMAIALVLYGLSHAIAHGVGLPFWAGAALTGLSILLLFAASGTVAWIRYGAAQRRSVGEKVSAEGASAITPPPANPATGAAA